jgi:type II secretory pathway pseudopilin PulG
LARTGPRLSLIETALLLCLIAVVAAVFVPTFLRRVRTNKISEASELLEEMSRRAGAYYDTSWASRERNCLPPAAGPTPAKPTEEPEAVDFSSPDAEGHASWEAIGFQPTRPIRFSYSYTPSAHGCDLPGPADEVSVVFRAEGDLDADDVRSVFERRAVVGRDGFTPADALLVHQRTE